jgi:hypothetical protein
MATKSASHSSDYSNQKNERDNNNKGKSSYDYESGDRGQWREELENIGSNLQERGRYITEQIKTRVEDHPWAFIGGTALAALLIGMLVGRRSSTYSSYSSM